MRELTDEEKVICRQILINRGVLIVSKPQEPAMEAEKPSEVTFAQIQVAVLFPSGPENKFISTPPHRYLDVYGEGFDALERRGLITKRPGKLPGSIEYQGTRRIREISKAVRGYYLEAVVDGRKGVPVEVPESIAAVFDEEAPAEEFEGPFLG